jgi:hypothetical protein
MAARDRAVMKYTVIWQPDAEDALADLWNAGPDRAAISAAADTIDQILSDDAFRKGQLAQADSRILICRPLAVYFTMLDDDRQVSVYAVWRWTP